MAVKGAAQTFPRRFRPTASSCSTPSAIAGESRTKRLSHLETGVPHEEHTGSVADPDPPGQAGGNADPGERYSGRLAGTPTRRGYRSGHLPAITSTW